MPVPKYIYVLPMTDDPIRCSDEDEEELNQESASIRGNESCDSLHSSWSRWDSSDAGICDRHGSNRRNIRWEAPRPNPTGFNSLLSDTNIRIGGSECQEWSNQKIPLSKARSLSPLSPSKQTSKLRSCPPRLPRESPQRGCRCKPPKAPVRRTSDTVVDCSSVCACGGADDPLQPLPERATTSRGLTV